MTGEGGAPVAAALGVNVVDEAVYALTEIKPGLEKVFFNLEREILQPKYEIHSASYGDVVSGGDTEDRSRRFPAPEFPRGEPGQGRR